MKRGESIRRSLGFRKKDKDKPSNQDPLCAVSEGQLEEKTEEGEEEEECEEVEETYILPELPHTPLSGTDSLDEAHFSEFDAGESRHVRWELMFPNMFLSLFFCLYIQLSSESLFVVTTEAAEDNNLSSGLKTLWFSLFSETYTTIKRFPSSLFL